METELARLFWENKAKEEAVQSRYWLSMMKYYGIIFTNRHFLVLCCFALFSLVLPYTYQSTVVMPVNHILFHCQNSSYYYFAFLDQSLKLQHGRGKCSVFILDTSESMSGEGLRQMKEALLCILNGMSLLLFIWTIVLWHSKLYINDL